MRVQPSLRSGVKPRSPLLILGVGVGGLLLGLAVGGMFGSPGRGLPVRTPRAELPAVSATQSWSLATYNLHNLFDSFDNPYTVDEQTPPKTTAELATLAEALRMLDADVVVLQEVESGGFLAHFVANQLGGATGGLHYAYVADEPTGDPRGIGLGVLSRFPIERIVSHRLARLDPEKPFVSAPGEAANHFARDLLRVDLQIRPGYLVSVYGVHLKSKRLDAMDTSDPQASTHWRLAEARAARRIIQEEMAQSGHARFIVAGDFNDGPDSAPVRELTQGPGWDQLRPDEPTAPGEGLLDGLASLPPAARVTYIAGRQSSSADAVELHAAAIDQIWLSPVLAQQQLSVEKAGAAVLRGGAFERASDHRPARIRLAIAN